MNQGLRRQDAALLDTLPLSDQARSNLVERMSAPARHYHTMRHLDTMWRRHCQYGCLANFIDGPMEMPIAFAIAYHDAVYVGGASDNEERSARLWLDVSAAGLPIEEADRLWVADTIRATAVHLEAARGIDMRDPRDRARQWVLDLDLTPLGEAPDAFDANTQRLAAELPHLSAGQRHDSIVGAIRHFAQARPLYRCHEIGDVFEEAAQRNFKRWLGGAERAS